jgi:UDPglucose 6-dehydrogenase
MKLAVIGTGYVGLVVGACLAETGNDVVCVDRDAAKIRDLEKAILPIYEPGLQDLVERNQRTGRLSFTTAIEEAVPSAEVVFIAVGTPPDATGSADLEQVLEVADAIGGNLGRETVVVTKSTVPPGTTALVAEAINRRAKFPFHICSNPEFLKEGAAVEDFMKPDRVILGTESDYARSVMAELYAPFVRTGKPILFMDIVSAEMTKYAANAMLATRITLMNEIANLCENVGANVDLVRKGIGSDSRLGLQYLFPGPGYGGSCFPKDVKALIQSGRDHGCPLQTLEAVDRANERQRRVLLEKLEKALGNVHGVRVAIWGLSFKPNTDDMRESPALALIDGLLERGAYVVVHDPAALEEARRRYGERIEYAARNYDALDGADALVVVTDWNEYRRPDLQRVRSLLRRPVVVDGRNLYDPARMAALGFEYYSIGRPAVGAARTAVRA